MIIHVLFSSLFASQRRKKGPKKEEKTQLFSTSSLRSAVFGNSVSPNFFVHFYGYSSWIPSLRLRMTGVFWLGLFTGLPSSSKRSFGDPADLIILKRFRNDRICLFDDISISWIPKPNGLRMTVWLDFRTLCENDGWFLVG